MKQYELCIQNNNNNKNKDKNENKKGKGNCRGKRERGRPERFLFFIFLLFAFFSDLRKSDRRFSSGLKAKLIHVARATRGYQNLLVSSNSIR